MVINIQLYIQSYISDLITYQTQLLRYNSTHCSALEKYGFKANKYKEHAAVIVLCFKNTYCP